MIVISHTLETGTVVYGTGRGDGSGPLIRQSGFRPSRHLDDHPDHGQAYWYVASSRRRPAKRDHIDRCAAALRAAGFEVTVEIDNTTLPTTAFADFEAERYDRAHDRTERFSEHADSAISQGSAMIEQVAQERQRIPMGQPHLIGHHSYNRTVRAEERRNAKEERGREHLQRGERWSQRAESSAHYRAGREDLGTTLRRIDRLEADIRAHRRELAGTIRHWEITVTADWADEYGKSLDDRLAALPEGSHVIFRNEERGVAEVLIAVTPERRVVIEAQITLKTEEVDYWKGHVSALQERQGKKVWSRADFSRGDFVKVGKRWHEVVRVNPKTLTVANRVDSHLLSVVTLDTTRDARSSPGWTDRLPYHQAQGHMTAAEAHSRFPDAFTVTAPGPGETTDTGHDGGRE